MTYQENGYLPRVGYAQQFHPAAAGVGPFPAGIENGYLLEETGTANRNDSVGTRSLGIYNGAINSTTGLIGNASQFTEGGGHNAQSNAANTIYRPGTTDITMCVWANCTNTYSLDRSMVSYWAAGAAANWALRKIASNTYEFQVWDGSFIQNSIATRSGVGTGWHFFACVWDLSTKTGYLSVDADTLTNDQTLSGTPRNNADTFYLGRDDAWFAGDYALDMCYVWLRTLSQTEISDVYNGGAGRVDFP